MKKPSVFKSEFLQNEFNENGFVKFRLLSIEQVQSLHDFYLKTQQQHETVVAQKKFHATNDTDNSQLIKSADNFIKNVMFEEIGKHFYNYKTISASYLLKQPSDESELGPHQDLRFVDEENYYSFNIWVATEPTHKNNGCLRFLKGSHNFKDTIRPLPAYPWRYRNVADIIPRFFTDITTEVGECVVLNHACIHASYPNLSGKIRIAAILAMVPQEAEIVHYFLPEGNPDNLVEKYNMTLEDFVNLKGGQRPIGATLAETFKYDFSSVEKDEFLTWISNNRKDQSFMTYGYELARKKLSNLFRIT